MSSKALVFSQGLAMLALVGCVSTPETPIPPAPVQPPPDVTAPDKLQVKPPARQVPERSERSRQLQRYYTSVQSDLLDQGLLRTDAGGFDTPYTDTDLVEDFIAVAFYDEYSQNEGLIRAHGEDVGLTKWTSPVRVKFEFGKSIPENIRSKDRAELESYVARLARVTGHPITMSSDAPNFYVLEMSEDDRLDAVQRIRNIVPDTSPAALAAIENLPRSVHCLVVTFSETGTRSSLKRAVAIIRAEHPEMTRKACIHEEVAQGLGLTNDSPHARPSIFNDDDEFAFLTTHDEDLLKILYSPDLKPGMSIDEATPIVRRLARELRPGES